MKQEFVTELGIVKANLELILAKAHCWQKLKITHYIVESNRYIKTFKEKLQICGEKYENNNCKN